MSHSPLPAIHAKKLPREIENATPTELAKALQPASKRAGQGQPGQAIRVNAAKVAWNR
jgi:hypothetical protein